MLANGRAYVLSGNGDKYDTYFRLERPAETWKRGFLRKASLHK